MLLTRMVELAAKSGKNFPLSSSSRSKVVYNEARTDHYRRFSGTQRSIDEDVSRVKAILSDHGGGQFESALTEEAMHNLWAARKEALWAMLAQRPDGSQIWSTDVAVPISRMAEIIGKRQSFLPTACESN